MSARLTGSGLTPLVRLRHHQDRKHAKVHDLSYWQKICEPAQYGSVLAKKTVLSDRPMKGSRDDVKTRSEKWTDNKLGGGAP
ncbi:Hypothetical protein CINCED_3A019442 [Cinara cedri]|uniref:Uncharacterized protein n=1 Tax=Cinara cedri TaxID=506608 RepID=A0A5E4NP79_9HEMI|nr:Hypothetical protein CINCED_3A019442 [Cinara cedri]